LPLRGISKAVSGSWVRRGFKSPPPPLHPRSGPGTTPARSPPRWPRAPDDRVGADPLSATAR
jgi:hypothetical protein